MKGALLSLTRQVLCLIPLILILPLFLGIDGILFAGPFADGIAFLITTIFISRQMKQIRQMEKMQVA